MESSAETVRIESAKIRVITECAHHFFEVTKRLKLDTRGFGDVEGIRVMCVRCGQMRDLWSDGKLDIGVK